MGIFKRKDRKAWYCKVDGKFVSLSHDRDESLKTWHELLAGHRSPVSGPNVRDVLKEYFDWLKFNRAETTWSRREPVLKSFSKECGSLKASQIKPINVTKWAQDRWGDASPTTRHNRMSTIQTAFRWAHRQGLLTRNPIAFLEKPTPISREHFVPVEDWPRLIEACTPPFDNVVRFCLLTGCRAEEIIRLRVEHFVGNKFVLPVLRSKGRKRNRVIHLSTDAIALVENILPSEGAVFVNQRGRPWTKNSINCRIRRLKTDLDWPWLCLTVLRHSFAHAHVRAGTDSLLLQQLMGHRDGRMLSRVYGHAGEASEQLSTAVEVTSLHLPAPP